MGAWRSEFVRLTRYRDEGSDSGLYLRLETRVRGGEERCEGGEGGEGGEGQFMIVVVRTVHQCTCTYIRKSIRKF